MMTKTETDETTGRNIDPTKLLDTTNVKDPRMPTMGVSFNASYGLKVYLCDMPGCWNLVTFRRADLLQWWTGSAEYPAGWYCWARCAETVHESYYQAGDDLDEQADPDSKWGTDFDGYLCDHLIASIPLFLPAFSQDINLGFWIRKRIWIQAVIWQGLVNWARNKFRSDSR